MCAKRAPQRLLTEFDPSEAAREPPKVPDTPGNPPGPGWEAAVSQFLDWKQAETPVGEDWIQRMRWELLRFPRLLERVGVTNLPSSPREVSPEQVMSLRKGLSWEKATFALHFAALRQFLAWAENPIAGKRGVWSLPSGESSRRRWITRDQLLRLYKASSGTGRLLVALEGLNGLRRVEVLRLRAKDVALEEGCLNVLGKGRNGGKWRRIPIFPAARSVLEEAIVGSKPADRLLPLSRSGADLLLARTVKAAGLAGEGVRVSHHDLRRGFGRIANAAGVSLLDLRHILGHTSLEMAARYVGLDADSMRAGLARMSDVLGPLC